MDITIKPKFSLHGSITVPGDKSISHRAVMLGSVSQGITEIEGFLTGDDCLSTISCFRKLGIHIDINGSHVSVHGKGIHGLSSPSEVLNVGNSGTTLRLMSGLLSAQPFTSELTGDASIQKRPMDRVANPLRLMQSEMLSLSDNKNNEHIFAPIRIVGKPLKGINYILPVASAQVKSAIILAGIYAQGETVITEPEPTRSHTEIMLNYLGADIKTKNVNQIVCQPVNELYGKKIIVPGDISSAAYFIVAGIICKDSELTINDVGINETRTGIITALLKMGASIEVQNSHLQCGELVGDISVKTSRLHGAEIGGLDIPRLIDEIPIIAVAACFAEGTTIIKNAEELKVKESNRIKTVVTELKKFGADIEETFDGMIINGGKPLYGTIAESYDDHRIAMALSILALCCEGETLIKNSQCVDISFPGFYDYIIAI